MFRVHTPIIRSIRCWLQHLVSCTEFLDGWWSWEPLRRSCVRCYFMRRCTVKQLSNTSLVCGENIIFFQGEGYLDKFFTKWFLENFSLNPIVSKNRKHLRIWTIYHNEVWSHRFVARQSEIVKLLYSTSSEIFTVVSVKIDIVWDVTPYSLIAVHRVFSSGALLPSSPVLISSSGYFRLMKGKFILK